MRRSHDQTLKRINMKFDLVHDTTKLSVRPSFQVLRPKYGKWTQKRYDISMMPLDAISVFVRRSYDQTLKRITMKFDLVHYTTKLSVRPSFQVLRPKYGEMETNKI